MGCPGATAASRPRPARREASLLRREVGGRFAVRLGAATRCTAGSGLRLARRRGAHRRCTCAIGYVPRAAVASIAGVAQAAARLHADSHRSRQGQDPEGALLPHFRGRPRRQASQEGFLQTCDRVEAGDDRIAAPAPDQPTCRSACSCPAGRFPLRLVVRRWPLKRLGIVPPSDLHHWLRGRRRPCRAQCRAQASPITLAPSTPSTYSAPAISINVGRSTATLLRRAQRRPLLRPDLPLVASSRASR